MEGHKFINNKVLAISLNDNIYKIRIGYSKQYLEDSNEYFFTLEKRGNGKSIYLQSSIIDEVDNFIILQLELDFNENKEIFSSKSIWDFYINEKKDGSVKKKRIKGTNEEQRFLAIVLSEKKCIFYPYTTNKGNLSFQLNEYALYSKFTSVQLVNNQLEFSGYIKFPPIIKKDELKKVFLIIKNNIGDNNQKIDLKFSSENFFLDSYNEEIYIRNINFKGKFNFLIDSDLEKNPTFKFCVEAIYEEGDLENKIHSNIVSADLQNKTKIRKIVRINNSKFEINIKQSKKSKALLLQVKKYSFKRSILNKIKTRWIKIRRSKKSRILYQGVFSLVGKLPAKKNTIVFESFSGKQYSDSPRAIYEYLSKYHPEYNMYWSVSREYLEAFSGKNLKYVRRFSIKWLFLMARAQYWVINSRLPVWLPKPKNTIYLQTWHGTPLKKLAADMEEVHMPGTNTKKYKKNFIKEASKWDYLVSPNRYSTEIFKRAFKYNGKIIESGYPRNDFLINENTKEKILRIKQKIGLPIDRKIILYAPTWRDNQYYAKGKYKFELNLDLDYLKKELSNDYIILLRLHYLIAENLKLSGYENFIYDLSMHEDIRELYLISDILITDYSSVFFDYANLRRPMIFYVYDIEEYRDNLRGFYFDFEKEAPGPLVKTTIELVEEIKKIEKKEFDPPINITNFYQTFCYLEDGKSTKRVVEKVFDNDR